MMNGDSCVRGNRQEYSQLILIFFIHRKLQLALILKIFFLYYQMFPLVVTFLCPAGITLEFLIRESGRSYKTIFLNNFFFSILKILKYFLRVRGKQVLIFNIFILYSDGQIFGFQIFLLLIYLNYI